jgi:putative zinc finger protein
MSNHVTEWLNAYFDGELHGHRLEQVEEHLAKCKTCQAELGSLQSLSGWLHEVPVPEFISSERFATQVNLLLPHQQPTTPENKLFEIGWWLIPVGLLATWVFISTSTWLSDIVSAANYIGVLKNVSGWIAFGSANNVYWSNTLGQFGVLPGHSSNWAEAIEVFARASLPQFIVHISIAIIYLSWLALWWSRHTHQAQNQRLES